MRVSYIYLVLLLICSHSNAQSALDEMLRVYNTHSVPYISVQELRMYQTNSKVHILDARERSEFEISKIPFAEFIGYREFSSEAIVEKFSDPETMIVVYCTLGIRSEQIAEKLRKAGFANVKNLYGGIFEWKNNGYPVTDSEGNETDKVHVFSKSWGKWLLNGVRVY